MVEMFNFKIKQPAVLSRARRALLETHLALGGPIFLDGELCYSQGSQVANPFRFNPVPPEQKLDDRWLSPEDLEA
jgi:hypothetical protein